jgi:2,3-bisphosphoglycerate-independent phosphoglycerate mutase
VIKVHDMDYLALMKEISRSSPTKIVLIVIDGLGGLPNPEIGRTELESAHIPNLDTLTATGVCGLADPIAPGITPGSAPGHLALFGYDPISCNIGRGVLEAIGIDIELQPGDVAARGNFCTVDEKGLVTDRRAGRISTEKCTELCKLLDGISVDGVNISVYPVREHRFVAVFHGSNLLPDVTESDPQQTGFAPLLITAVNPGAAKLADAANRFIARVKEILAKQHPANMVLLRGFSRQPDLPTMSEIYKLKPLAIAVYPMYRGLARLVGMDIARTGTTLADEFTILKQHYKKYDFFFLHIKWTDSAGEDGDFGRKVDVLEQIDKAMPGVVNMEPDVLVITGDHSTPAMLSGHSWHPVPVLICSKYCRPDNVSEFSEPTFLQGGLGRINATQIMPLAMANALKLNKFGA